MLKNIRTLHRRGRTHIVDEIRDGVVTTLCRRYFIDFNLRVFSEIHPKVKLCKPCEKANSQYVERRRNETNRLS